MNELLEFLSSAEAIIVYIVVVLSCCLCFIIYLVEKNNAKVRQRHNTKELNKLVSQVKEEAQIEDQPMYDVPILEKIEDVPDVGSLSEMLAETQTFAVVPAPVEEIPKEVVVEQKEPLILEDIDILEEAKEKADEELEYTSIEPDQETAKLELQRLTEELKKQEEMQEAESDTISLTNYEEEQEENAIISLEELVRKGKDIYEANELTQYDEATVPISLSELENQIGKEASPVVDNFAIEEVVPEEEVLEELPLEKPVVHLDDFHSAVVPKENVEPPKKFKSSPIISPIYGIEKESDGNQDITLENTANYEKLDKEIQKTNEFLMTLKELQQKLD